MTGLCSRPVWRAGVTVISRVRSFQGLRLLQFDPAGIHAVAALKHDEKLYAWECGYDGNGRWSDARALTALIEVQQERRAAKKQAAERKKNAQARTSSKEKEGAAGRRSIQPLQGRAPSTADTAPQGANPRKRKASDAKPCHKDSRPCKRRQS